MRKFGLIGGTSWHSTVKYYATINQIINDHYNDNTNPPLRLVNLNQKQLHDFQRADDWEAIATMFIAAARELQTIDVEGIALCANTPHKIFNQLSAEISCPIVHIADAVGSVLVESGIRKTGLLGTRFTMSENFIKGRLLDQYQIETLVPSANIQEAMQERIYHELVVGTFADSTQEFCLEVIQSLAQQKAEAVILGCTELPLLLEEVSCPIPLIDSLQCHCEAITRYILH